MSVALLAVRRGREMYLPGLRPRHAVLSRAQRPSPSVRPRPARFSVRSRFLLVVVLTIAGLRSSLAGGAMLSAASPAWRGTFPTSAAASSSRIGRRLAAAAVRLAQ